MAESTTEGPLVARADRFHSQPPASPAGSAQDWVGDLNATAAPHVHSAHSTQGDHLSLDQITAIAKQQHIVPPYQIAMPKGPTGVYSVRSLSTNPRDAVYLHLDQYSGAVLASIPFSELNPLAQTVGVGIAVHEGRMFGRVNQLFGLFASLGSAFIAVMGAVLWWSRRPKGKFGGPVLRPDVTIPQSVVWITGLLGVVFPFVGLSILLMWLADRIVRRYLI
jgi:uncharacterized iron-regulated membrane protein